MRIGKLRHRLEILTKQTQKDDYGAVTDASDAIEATVWGELRPLGTNERHEAAKMQASASHIAKVRAQGVDISPKKRIRFKGRVYEVVGQMNKDERDFELNVMLRELT